MEKLAEPSIVIAEKNGAAQGIDPLNASVQNASKKDITFWFARGLI
jgi:hypothetical protein